MSLWSATANPAKRLKDSYHIFLSEWLAEVERCCDTFTNLKLYCQFIYAEGQAAGCIYFMMHYGIVVNADYIIENIDFFSDDILIDCVTMASEKPLSVNAHVIVL